MCGFPTILQSHFLWFGYTNSPAATTLLGKTDTPFDIHPDSRVIELIGCQCMRTLDNQHQPLGILSWWIQGVWGLKVVWRRPLKNQTKKQVEGRVWTVENQRLNEPYCQWNYCNFPEIGRPSTEDLDRVPVEYLAIWRVISATENASLNLHNYACLNRIKETTNDTVCGGIH